MPKLYHSVPIDEDANSETSFQEKKLWTAEPREGCVQRVTHKIRRHWAWLAHAVLLTMSLTMFALSFCARTAKPTDQAFHDKYATYSPAFPIVKYSLQRYDLGPVTNSPFAGYGEKVDRQWDVIANTIGDIMITEDERVKLGLSPDSVRIQNPRTGEWGYRAGVEVFHQLHCLNVLRQAVHADYYNSTEIGGDVGAADSFEDLVGHVDHCIEAIRLNLMCQADVGVFTFKAFPHLVDQGIDGNWPDFEINHMCRNFEDIRKWNNEHAVAWDHDV